MKRFSTIFLLIVLIISMEVQPSTIAQLIGYEALFATLNYSY